MKPCSNKRSNLVRITTLVIVLLVCSISAFAGNVYFTSTSNTPGEYVYDYELYAGVQLAPAYSTTTDTSTYTSIETSSAAQSKTTVTAVAAASTPVYYGPGTSYAFCATLSSSRTVTVCEKDDDSNFYLCEYSVSSGLFRGYIHSYYLTGDLSGVPTSSNNISKYALNTSTIWRYVYAGPNDLTYAKTGYISSREIISVLKAENSSWYQIMYYTSDGYKVGYIPKTNISIPAVDYGFCQPIFSGTRGTDYSAGTHNGIDIVVNEGVSLYSMADGTAYYCTAHEVEGNSKVMVSYGNYVKLNIDDDSFQTDSNLLAIYAHMKTFSNGFGALTYSNANPPRGQSSSTEVNTVGQKTVSYGSVLGTSGNTGNSTGAHLHFEIREIQGNTSTIVDPFKYVLFAKMPY